ncbi:MAG: putative DNA binding domain-containing protein [Chitinivibrionia bacterium]|nr:putative DNA binding domain-containing protein [Chitinivibrionia bacterium]
MNQPTHPLVQWLAAKENEHLEFKEAKNNFHFEKLVKYCAALSNEGGGSIVLGVTDKRPRKIVGSQAFQDLERTKAGLIERLRLRIEAEEVQNSHGRVVIFTAPPHPIGVPIALNGAYWMRAGEDLAPMTPDILRRIFAEAGPDFSAEICPGATLAELAPDAIAEFRGRWYRRAKIDSLLQSSPEQLLRDAELMTDAGVTYAALVLLGTRAALGKHLAQAEVVFEYRSSEAAGPAGQREEFREGAFLYYDRLWELVNLRNEKQHYQDGLFMVDIPTFSEGAVREAILNAVSHRDYRYAGSVFIRQFPRRIEVVSPGGFPQGITAENILDRQQPRNRRIADAFARCGLVDRSGQGANRIFESCIREGKALPDFTHTDTWQVAIALNCQVQDPRFVRFLERIGRELAASFDTHEFLVLDLVHREEPIPANLQLRLRRLVELGVVESVGRGKGTRYLLSRRFYAMIGQQGTYTRRKGLDDETHKELLLRHLLASPAGSPLSELHQVLPHLSERKVQVLLHTLNGEGRVALEGSRRWARWKAAKDMFLALATICFSARFKNTAASRNVLTRARASV